MDKSVFKQCQQMSVLTIFFFMRKLVKVKTEQIQSATSNSDWMNNAYRQFFMKKTQREQA